MTIPRELPIKSINTTLKPDSTGNVDITKSTVGLNNVDNTSDANKPVSTATQTALNLKADKSEAVTNVAYDSTNKKLTKTIDSTTSDIVTVATLKTALELGKNDVGLSNVDNTSDANKPISTAAQSALDLKAPLASPALTGTPTAPTAAAGTNTTQIATTEFVMSAFRANDAMVFKGTIGNSGATVTTLPAIHYQGWTYKVITAGTYAGVSCEIGDMIICVMDGVSDTDSHWSVIQSNIDGAVTGPAASIADHVATFNGSSGKVIKDSGYTIAKSVPADAMFTDTNTTYTLTQDEDDEFTLIFTPSTGEATQISIPDTSVSDLSEVTGTLNIAHGGTGATTASAARTALGLGAAAVKGTVSSITTSNDLPTSTAVKNYVTKSNVGLSNVANIDQSKAIKSITRSGTTFTVTYLDGTTGTFDQQDTDTWIAMVGATSSGNGTAGYVPAPPSTGYNTKYLRADGAWVVPPNDNTTYSGTSPISVSGSVVSHETSGVTSGSKGDTSNQTPSFGSTFKVLSGTVNETGHLTAFEEHTVKIPNATATTSSAGLMSSTDKTNLDGLVTTVGGLETAVAGKVDSSTVGAASGIATLDSSGKVPSSQLPSYVDDVLEYAGTSSFPATGEAGKIYVDTSTNKTYRWGGSSYAEISESLALGTTSSTAYRGDYGNAAYAHAVAKGAAYASGLYKITTNSEGHVTTAVAVQKSDITDLGVADSVDFSGATSQAAGAHGLVPAPAVSDVGKFLGAAGAWTSIPVITDSEIDLICT